MTTKRGKTRIEKWARQEIEKRGGEIEIVGRYGTEEVGLLDSGQSEGRAVHLVGCDGWRQYSRAFGARRAALRYLYGVDDSGRWAVRVPGTVESVREGLDWLEPAKVKRARERGKRVFRQGNVYLVETSAKYSETGECFALGEHRYFSHARVMLHGEHAPLRVPGGHFTAVQQKAVSTVRGAAVD